MSVVRAPLTLALGCALALSVSTAGAAEARHAARGADARHDGVYARFDGDLELDLGLGTELGTAGSPAGLVRGAAYYYTALGLYALGRVPLAHASARGLFEPGIELRPLFLLRWREALEQGPSLLDLTLDSCSLSAGAFWASPPGGQLGGEHGFVAGLGFGIPLFRTANGPWLETRGQLRLPSHFASEQALYVLFGWHAFAQTPFVGD